MQILSQIEHFLRNAIGLRSASIGTASIIGAIRERMQKQGINHERAYLDLLTASTPEQDALIERIVVPETWFFRDDKPFETLRDHILGVGIPRLANSPLQILSIPCSTGEEPYSIAMTLLDLGLPPSQWRLDAYDISRKALAKARAAIYGKHSFRSRDLSFRDRYFHSTGQCYALDPSVMRTVHFAYGNLLELSCMHRSSRYDIIFFRNLMIYLGEEEQQQALSALAGMLADSGLLFIGHAEASPLLEGWFSPIANPGAFAYRRRQAHAEAQMSLSTRRRTPRPSPPIAPLEKSAPAPLPMSAAVPVNPTEATAATSEALLGEAQRCADGGALEQAFRLCESVLQTGHCRTAAYYLQGLIYDARDETAAAEDCFRRALYLEPDHYEALTHSALIAERRGDTAAAARLRARARRAETRYRANPS